MKTIFYILSVLIILASAYFAFENKNKLDKQIAIFNDQRATNVIVGASTAKTQTSLDDTNAALVTAKSERAKAAARKESETSKAENLAKTIDRYKGEIEGYDAELAKFDAIEKKVAELMKGQPITFEQIPAELEKLENKRKGLQKEFEELEVTIAGLEKNVATNREEISRQTDRLVVMRKRIARNAQQGRITSVDPVWGFVIVNLGSKNSNVDAESDLLVYRNNVFLGRLNIQSIEPNQTISDVDLKNLRPGQRLLPGDTVILAKSVGN